eukprot:3900169-Pleurochrysis_carterae.AAC.3
MPVPACGGNGRDQTLDAVAAQSSGRGRLVRCVCGAGMTATARPLRVQCGLGLPCDFATPPALQMPRVRFVPWAICARFLVGRKKQ